MTGFKKNLLGLLKFTETAIERCSMEFLNSFSKDFAKFRRKIQGRIYAQFDSG